MQLWCNINNNDNSSVSIKCNMLVVKDLFVDGYHGYTASDRQGVTQVASEQSVKQRYTLCL